MLTAEKEFKPIFFVPKGKKVLVPPHLIPSEIMIYLKTTETCQLNCKHCFTNGINGKKVYFNPDLTIEWFRSLHRLQPNMKGGNIAFHGGEPFLAPVEDMKKVWLACKDLWPNVQWTTTTNLVYKLTDEIRSFMKEVFTHGFATSWDKGIRFDNNRQEDLWKSNIKTLKEDGHAITLMVSLNRQITDMDPYEFIELIVNLVVVLFHLERITPNGNALSNHDIMPDNKTLDEWFLKLWEATVNTKCHTKFLNIFFNGVLSSYVNSAHTGCRCRSCEQKIFTLNADGTIGGCPNSAVNNTFGVITDAIEDLLVSQGRIENIACETHRDPRCYDCEVYDICNGDCHQLVWQDDYCAAPKSFMKLIKKNNDLELYNTVLDGFRGRE